MSTNYSIIVTVKVKPNMADQFLPQLLNNAKATREVDQNCMQFQVFEDPRTVGIFHYVETYISEEALASHREDDHVKAFFAATNDMIVEKNVRVCTRLSA